MSAVLDNLTTTIVMVSLIKKILPDKADRKLFGALIVIAGYNNNNNIYIYILLISLY